MIPLFFPSAGRTLLWVALAGYTALVVILIVNVLSENRKPLNALAWIMALVFFPIGGPLLYFFVGRSLRGERMISRRNRRRLINSEPRLPLPRLDKRLTANERQCIRLAYSVADAMLYPGNTVELFNRGDTLFEALFADLENATDYINLQFYIIANDNVGRRLRDILVRKAAAGVKVRVIYDYVGSFGGNSRELFRSMREAGVEVHAFFRIEFPDKLGRLNWRNHRKVVVIDGKTGYIGGFNVARRYVDGGRFDCWRDLMVRLSGPAVAGLQSNFAIDWKFMGCHLLTDPIRPSADRPDPEAISDVSAQIVASGPTGRWTGSLFMYFKAISGATRRAWIQTPYFLPSDDLLTALKTAALSGVDVRVMVPDKSDSTVLTYASDSFIEECLLAGIKVYRFRAGMLHSKLLIVDDNFSTLGSTNFDYRSFDHNFEENIVMYSGEANSRLAGLYEADLAECQRLKLSQWNRRPRKAKILESLCRLLSPVL